MQGFVAAGVGVSLIAELGLTTIRDDIVVRDLGRETPVRKIYAAVSGGYRTPATGAMLEVLAGDRRGLRDAAPAALARRLRTGRLTLRKGVVCRTSPTHRLEEGRQ